MIGSLGQIIRRHAVGGRENGIIPLITDLGKLWSEGERVEHERHSISLVRERLSSDLVGSGGLA